MFRSEIFPDAVFKANEKRKMGCHASQVYNLRGRQFEREGRRESEKSAKRKGKARRAIEEKREV